MVPGTDFNWWSYVVKVASVDMSCQSGSLFKAKVHTWVRLVIFFFSSPLVVYYITHSSTVDARQ